MKLSPALLISALLPAVMAVASDSLTAVVVSYPKDTPDSVVADAKKAIVDGGGKITHEYTLIKGFAAQAPKVALEQVKTLDSANPVSIEEDQVMSIN